MANKGLGLPQTKGEFKLRGYSTGLKRNNAFKSITTKSQKDMKILNFGVQTAPESTVFVTLQGVEKDKVIYSKKSEEQGKESEKREVAWDKRYEQQPEGFKLQFSVGVGLEKDEKGKNIIKNLTDYDAAGEVYSKLKDGTPVFVYGELEYSSFGNKDEIKRSKKFNVKNIYLASAIDFEAEDFAEVADFKQRIIFMGINKIDDKEDPRFQVEAKIVGYNTVEDTDFIIRDQSLANQFRRNLKPYAAIDVWGRIFNKVDAEELEQEAKSVWGEEDSFKKVNKPYIRELVITGANPESIDTETYTEEAINEALKALKEFGQAENSTNETWGSKNNPIEIDEDDLPW